MKSKKRKPKKRKAATIKQEPQKQTIRNQLSLIKCFWKSIVGFSVIVGICVSLLSLSANISVIPGKSFNADDPLATPFIITNEGLLPLHSVKIFWKFNFMRSQNIIMKHGNISYASPPIRIINRKEQKTFFYPPAFKFLFPLNSADIAIRVLYRQSFLFWHQVTDFRFVIVRDKNGITRWMPKPMAEEPKFPN